ncbi:PHP domain-containing protein, partial [Clostridium saudiense]|nr:PHP domain-containing protein [Clostridium saudiense]
LHNVIENNLSNSKKKSSNKENNEKSWQGNKDYNKANKSKEYTKSSKKEDNAALILGRSATFRDNIIKIIDITPYEGTVAIAGEIANMESKELRSGKMLVSFDLYDGSSSISCKCFVKGEQYEEVVSRIKKAKGIKLWGNSGVSKFTGEIEVIANTIVETSGMTKTVRQDNSEVKRVELHMHTKMSQMDAMSSASDLIKRAMSWGMKSIAITDHGVVQAFPEAHKLLGRNNENMKVIYGVEAYLAPDKKSSVTNGKGQSIDTTYCVLDLETTGFSPKTEKITEIGIMKVKDGKVIDKFSTFVNPEKPIPQRVVEVTNITDD